tara:strand:- start:53 stop:280 length:228 start_codon:yes stop_codon:yes gene_type:complete
MYVSEAFGRHFWVDDEDNLKSAPSYIDGTADFECEDYVSEWDDLDGVNLDLLLQIHKTELHNKWSHAGSLSLRGA